MRIARIAVFGLIALGCREPAAPPTWQLLPFRIEPETVTVHIGQAIQFHVRAQLADGSSSDVTAYTSFTSLTGRTSGNIYFAPDTAVTDIVVAKVLSFYPTARVRVLK